MSCFLFNRLWFLFLIHAISSIMTGCQETIVSAAEKEEEIKRLDKASEHINAAILPTSLQVQLVSQLVIESHNNPVVKAALPEESEQTIAPFLLATSCHRSVGKEPAPIARHFMIQHAKGDFTGILTGHSVTTCATIVELKDWRRTDGGIKFVAVYQLPDSFIKLKRTYEIGLQPDGRWLFQKSF